MVEFVEIVFVITSVFILFAMYKTWTVKQTMQAAYWLVMLLAAVAVIFLLANSEVIFAFQISIYAGGISVLLLFAALLTQHDDYLVEGDLGARIRSLAPQIFASLLIVANIILLSLNSVFPSESILGDTSKTTEQAFEHTEKWVVDLWSDFAITIPFLAMLLLAALLGSVKLVIREWELEDLSKAMNRRYNPNTEDSE